MMKRVFGILLAAALLLGAAGCGAKAREESAAEQMRQNLSQSFQTTAKVRYGGLETEMTIYKKPMNCAVVTFQSPESIRDIKMTFFTDKVTVQYGDLSFDFTPDSVPGQGRLKDDPVGPQRRAQRPGGPVRGAGRKARRDREDRGGGLLARGRRGKRKYPETVDSAERLRGGDPEFQDS